MTTPLFETQAGGHHIFILWVYCSVFFLGFLESLPFIGLTFPAAVLMILAGTTAYFGWTDMQTMTVLAIAGSMLSNVLGYEADSYVRPFIQKRPVLTEQVEKARTFLKKFGALSIVLARFRTFSRSLISLVAAEEDMPRLEFYGITFVGIVLITVLRLGAGYLSAAGLQFAFYWVTRREGFLLGLVVVALPAFILWKWAIRKGRRALIVLFSLIQSSLRLVSRHRFIAPFFKRYPWVKTFIHARFSRSDFFGIALTSLILMLLYLLHLLILLFASYAHNGTIITVDTQVANLLLTFRNHQMMSVFYNITLLASAQTIVGIMIVVSAVLWVKHHRTFLLALWSSILSATAVIFLIKTMTGRVRPSAVYAAIHEPYFALPSAHATYATVLYGTLAYIVLRSKTVSWRLKMSVLFLMSACILSISFSRLYLGVHFTSDVLAGILIGLVLLLLSIILSESLSQALHHTTVSRNISRTTLISLIGSCTAVVVSVIFASTTPSFLMHDDTADTLPVAVADIADIFNVHHQSKFTETLTGQPQEPLNIIIVSQSDRCLEKQFADAGWQEADALSPGSAYKAFRAAVLNEEYPTAPMTPYFYATLPHSIGMQQEADRRTVRIRHHLRLWKTPYSVPEGQVYLGTASFDRGLKWGGFRLGITHRIDPDLDTERTYISSNLSNAGVISSYTKTQLISPMVGRNFTGDPFVTDGQTAILVLRSCAH
mgnify:CR=1 FL=1